MRVVAEGDAADRPERVAGVAGEVGQIEEGHVFQLEEGVAPLDQRLRPSSCRPVAVDDRLAEQAEFRLDFILDAASLT